MNTLKILFKNRITVIVAVVLAVTLLISATVTSTLAKYTKSQNVTLDLSVKTGMPVLLETEGVKTKVAEKLYADKLYNNTALALKAIKKINIVTTTDYENEINVADDVTLGKATNLVTASGVVDVYWNSGSGTLTICSNKEIYANVNCNKMFYSLSSLEAVDFSNLNTQNTTNFGYFFRDCTSLTGFDFDYLETENATTMSEMFYNCSSLKSENLDLSNINTTKAKELANMFLGCTSLTTLDLSSFDNEVTNNISYFFKNCTNLKEINFGENFFVSTLSNLRGLFYGCSSLEAIDLTTFKMNENSGQIFEMFDNCTSLKTLDLSKFNTKNVTNFFYMFSDCSSLTEITFGDNFTTEKAQTVHNMFQGCSMLKNLGTLQLHLGNIQGNSAYYHYGLEYMFSGCKNLESVDFKTPYKGTGTIKVDSVTSMFEGCASLTEIDLTGFATGDFKLLTNMFSGCTNLKKIICADENGNQKFSTVNATQTAGMFNGCGKLEDLNENFEFNLTGIASAEYKNGNGNPKYKTLGSTANMFNGCAGLTSLTFEKGTRNTATDISAMFKGCTGLKELDLITFDFTGVTAYDGLFDGYTDTLTVTYSTTGWNSDLDTTTSGVKWANVEFKDAA